MKKKKMQTMSAVICCLLAFMTICQPLYAQTNEVSRDKWLQELKDEERKIEAYIESQMLNLTQNETLKQAFLSSIPSDEKSDVDLPEATERYLKNYYREQYVGLHPELKDIYNPGRVKLSKAGPDKSDDGTTTGGAPPYSVLCSDGDFEAGTSSLASFDGYFNGGYNGGLCSFIPQYPVSGYSNVGFGTFLTLTNNVPDPFVPSINQTRNGSNHAVQINSNFLGCTFGLSMLQKTFVPSATGTARVNFSYALVMQAAHRDDEENLNSFFVARVLDYTGMEVARICVPSIAPGFATTTTPRCSNGVMETTMYRDWDCDFLEFDAVANKTYTIEFFVSGCSYGIHFGYAYVDDICAEVICCPPPPSNVKCEGVPGGSYLSWDPVPDAIGYKVTIHSNDPYCCEQSNIQFMATWDVTGTSVLVPSTFTDCFSFTVNSVCESGEVSETLTKYCSCTPPCQAPTNFTCSPQYYGSILGWSAVPGAAYYELVIYNNDPFCDCRNQTLPFMAVYNTITTNYVIYSSFSPCFSWYVNTVCTDSTRSQSLYKQCSCTIPTLASLDGHEHDDEKPSPNVVNLDDHVQASAIPNPASAYVEFILRALDGPESNSRLTLHLYDMSGREWISKEASYNSNVHVDVQSYPVGDYIYEFKDGGRRVAIGKVTIQR